MGYCLLLFSLTIPVDQTIVCHGDNKFAYQVLLPVLYQLNLTGNSSRVVRDMLPGTPVIYLKILPD